MSKPAGRLKLFYSSWKLVTSDKQILQSVKGYKIPLIKNPIQTVYPPETKFSYDDEIHCKNAVSDLLSKGAIKKCNPCEGQFLSTYLLRDKPNGDKRFILNLKNLNRYVKNDHFKMEDKKTVIYFLNQGDYMATIDLKDAFFIIPIHKKYRKFLRFSFQGNLYEFCCLPFGLCTAPFVFTKILKPVAQILRSKGYLSVFYLDDLLLLGNTKIECKENVRHTINLLNSLGFILNEEKCNFEPSHICKFLGFNFDSQKLCISLPDEKRKAIQNLLIKFRNKSQCKIREWAQLIGVLIAACPGTKYGLLYTKNLEKCKYLALRRQNFDYEGLVQLPKEVYNDLNWWINNIKTTCNFIRNQKYEIEIFSDASLTGWGVYCKGKKSHGWWSDNEKMYHINVLELKAVFYGLKCFANNLNSCEILLRIDNTTALSYINKMGGVRFPVLSNLSREIWEWCEKRNLWLYASYVKSCENIHADEESRKISEDTEWELSKSAFKKINNKFGKFDMDLFATNINAKCERFISWFPDPDAFEVDAFTINWEKIYFYAFPPFGLITRVLKKIYNDKARGVLVIPFWPTQAWFPFFQKLLISDLIYFKPNKNLLKSPFREHHPLWPSLTLVAGILSANPLDTKEFRRQL